MPNPSVLIVEDDGLTALYLAELLSRAGYTVLDPVSKGEDSLDLLKRSIFPDIILMDIGLGGSLNGIETAHLVQKRRKIPIVFLTAYSERGTIQETSDLSACQYLVKPVGPEDLLAAIRNAIGTHTNPHLSQ